MSSDPLANTPNALTRAAFLRRAAALGLTASAAPLIAACGGSTTTSSTKGTSGKSLADLGKVGGTLRIATYAGYEGGDAIKPWLRQHGITQKVSAINNQDEVTTKLRSPAGRTIDAAQLGSAQFDQYRQLKLGLPIQTDWLKNLPAVEPFFVELVKDGSGALITVPFVWGGLGCNYDPKKLPGGIRSWKELIDPKFKGKIAMIDDPVSTVQTGALAVGIRKPETMTKTQLSQVKDFLIKVKANARTVAAGYADIGDLIVAGDVWASFQGWNAVEVFAASKGGTVKTSYPAEGTIAFVDSFMIPKDAANVASAVAFVDQMISPTMQTYVGNDLASGVVRLDVVDRLKGVAAKTFDYKRLPELFKTSFVFAPDAPIETSGDVANHADWVAVWEDVKST